VTDCYTIMTNQHPIISEALRRMHKYWLRLTSVKKYISMSCYISYHHTDVICERISSYGCDLRKNIIIRMWSAKEYHHSCCQGLMAGYNWQCYSCRWIVPRINLQGWVSPCRAFELHFSGGLQEHYVEYIEDISSFRFVTSTGLEWNIFQGFHFIYKYLYAFKNILFYFHTHFHIQGACL